MMSNKIENDFVPPTMEEVGEIEEFQLDQEK